MSLEIGGVYGRLTILSSPKTRDGKHSFCNARCSCGVEKNLRCDSIISGRVVSCGCHAASLKRIPKHGKCVGGTETREYRTWADMLQRCTNPRQPVYKYYGARGIKVCERWLKFANFLADMGVRPPDKTLDRIDNERGYEPGNCRWATHKEQMRNTRAVGYVYLNGNRVSVTGAADELGFPSRRIYWQVHKHGITHQQAMEKILVLDGRMA